MKRIISLLCVACLVLITACSDDKEVGPIFDSVLTPDFTFDDGAEIIAGVDAVQFTDNSTAKGTEISGYFWHFGFAGLGNCRKRLLRTLSCTRRPANMSLR